MLAEVAASGGVTVREEGRRPGCGGGAAAVRQGPGLPEPLWPDPPGLFMGLAKYRQFTVWGSFRGGGHTLSRVSI
jgi:hypothetical protein